VHAAARAGAVIGVSLSAAEGASDRGAAVLAAVGSALRVLGGTRLPAIGAEVAGSWQWIHRWVKTGVRAPAAPGARAPRRARRQSALTHEPDDPPDVEVA